MHAGKKTREEVHTGLNSPNPSILKLQKELNQVIFWGGGGGGLGVGKKAGHSMLHRC